MVADVISTRQRGMIGPESIGSSYGGETMELNTEPNQAEVDAKEMQIARKLVGLREARIVELEKEIAALKELYPQVYSHGVDA